MDKLEQLLGAIADVESANMMNAKEKAAGALRAVGELAKELVAEGDKLRAELLEHSNGLASRIEALERRAGILQHVEG